MSEQSDFAKITFAPMGAFADREQSREQWEGVFVLLSTAQKLCEMNEAEAEAAMERLILANPDEALEVLDAHERCVGILEDAINILNAGQARMTVGMARACAS